MGTPEGQRRTKVFPQPTDAASGPAPPGAAEAAGYGIPETEYTPRVRAALASLRQYAEALRRETEQLRKELEELSRTADGDSLLPILNRRAFMREVGRFIALAKRYGMHSSVLFFDIDGFKAVNDVHGHLGGDAVLRHFASVIAGQIRETDVFARLGGDEFGVILMQVALDQAEKKGTSLTEALVQNPPLLNGHTVVLRFSYGATELRAQDNPETAIERADKAMYAQKRSRYGALTR
jgi:diguanylate cyclase (GGDEF)-like protein